MDYAQSLFEAISESAVLLDRTGRIIDWNQGATSVFGYHKKEAIGKSLNLIYQQHHPLPKIIQEILPAEKKWSAETRYVRKNGIKGLCKTSISLLHGNFPNKASALVTHLVITPYKNLETELNEKVQTYAEQLQHQIELYYLSNVLLIRNLYECEAFQTKLRESELRFHLLAENATDVISRHAPDGTYLYISPSCKTQFGYTSEELLNFNSYKFIHYEDVGKLKKAFNRRKENTKHLTLMYRMRRKEGDYRWFESNIRHIYDEKNRIIREIQSATRDVTDRVLDKKARLRGQQLAHVSRLSSMEEMASGMAHEISQPLAAVVNYTQGCVRYLQNNQDTTQVIEIMKKAVIQAERAGEVIHRLKNFFCKGKLFKTPC
ncbi:MAG TPA: PAS domain S-box protein, partial [Gammaproteobacteria bacterium]|nr:PAS domain S-box protein [Gammaproteobacteria bacterium]